MLICCCCSMCIAQKHCLSTVHCLSRIFATTSDRLELGSVTIHSFKEIKITHVRNQPLQVSVGSQPT